MKRQRVGSLVVVKTHDIEHTNDGWTAYEAIVKSKPYTYRCAGWVLGQTKTHLVIAPEVNARTSKAFCAYYLPLGAIISIKVIAIAKGGRI